MENDRPLKLAHRAMQIGIAVACVAFVFSIYAHQRDTGRDNQLLSKHDALIISSQKMLDEVRRQQVAAKELLTVAESRLAAAENRQAAEKATAPRKAP